MKKINLIIYILSITLIIGGLSYFIMSSVAQPTPISPHLAGEKSTKLAVYNNHPRHWLHLDLVLENVTSKDGSVKTYYVDVMIKPGERLDIDLSQILGYTNEKLPPGTTIRILSWKGLANVNPGGTDTLNMDLQGWSNTAQPGNSAQKLNIIYNPAPVLKHPEGITQSQYLVSTVAADLRGVDLQNENIYEEEILTIDDTGNVNIRLMVTPELCTIIANIF